MVKCPYCASEITENNPVLAIQALRKWVEAKGGWDIFESDNSSYGFPVEKTFTVGNSLARVAAKKVTYDSGEIDRDGYYDSELPQGTTFNTFVVIEYAGSFFRKTGTGDSYNDISWNGELLPVVPKVKTIEVYEFNE